MTNLLEQALQNIEWLPESEHDTIASDILDTNSAIRVLEARKGDTINWFWIGSHHEYGKMIQSLILRATSMSSFSASNRTSAIQV